MTWPEVASQALMVVAFALFIWLIASALKNL